MTFRAQGGRGKGRDVDTGTGRAGKSADQTVRVNTTPEALGVGETDGERAESRER